MTVHNCHRRHGPAVWRVTMRFVFDEDRPAEKPTSTDAIRDVVMWAVLGWLVFAGVRALDHPSTWPAPATPEQYHALDDQ